MKKILILLTLWLVLPMVSFGQSQVFKNFFGKFSGNDGFTTVEMSGDMLRVVSGMDTSNSNASQLFDSVDKMYIIASEDGNNSFVKAVDDMISSGGYENMSTVRQDGDVVRIFMHGSGKTKECLLTAASGGDYVVIMVLGDLSVKQISQLAKINVKK